MFNTVLTKIFVAILSTVAMFFNFFGGLADNSKAPEGALRVHYAEGINCWYNMYIPETLQSGDETDVLFVVHGGGWMLLDESEHDEQCRNIIGH